MVAVVQLAITLGASAGGMLFDRWGYQSTFLASAALLTGSALAAVLAARATRAEPGLDAPRSAITAAL